MWLKVLSLFILCSIAFGANASPFGHAPKSVTAPLIQSDLSEVKSNTLSGSASFYSLSTLCISEKTSFTQLECCHVDTCSAFLINGLKVPSYSQYLDPHPLMIHWPFKPISNLKKPPKFIAA